MLGPEPQQVQEQPEPEQLQAEQPRQEEPEPEPEPEPELEREREPQTGRKLARTPAPLLASFSTTTPSGERQRDGSQATNLASPSRQRLHIWPGYCFCCVAYTLARWTPQWPHESLAGAERG